MKDRKISFFTHFLQHSFTEQVVMSNMHPDGCVPFREAQQLASCSPSSAHQALLLPLVVQVVHVGSCLLGDFSHYRMSRMCSAKNSAQEHPIGMSIA